jgi:Domain of unknown function (DUF6457)
MDDWLRRAVAAAGGEVALSAEDEQTLLDLARIAAHATGDRTNAPLLCYLLGRVQGERPLNELAEAVRRSSS